MISIDRPYGLLNLGNTCYMNSVLQTLFLCNDFNTDIIRNSQPQGSLINGYKTIIIKMMQRSNTNSKVRKLKLTQFINKFRNNFQHVSFHQQDAHEALQFILGNFHDTLKEEFTSDCLVENINSMRYNKEIKNECAKQLMTMYKKDYSLINKYFYGQVCNVIRCSNCNHEVNRVEVYKGIELSIEKSNDLFGCLEEHFAEEELEGYKCDECKKTQCSKQMVLLNTPKYLLVTLKRFNFSYQTNRFAKNTKNVDFPIYLHFKKYLLQDNDNKKVNNSDLYKLKSVINHSGGANNGHYTSYNNFKKKWVECDDDDVKIMDEDKIFTPAAYVLVYEKKDIN